MSYTIIIVQYWLVIKMFYVECHMSKIGQFFAQKHKTSKFEAVCLAQVLSVYLEFSSESELNIPNLLYVNCRSPTLKH